jgi:nucleotide-binding universal stress UspA family protein
MKVNKILVPVDFSEATEDLIAYAKYIAKQFNSQIDLFHVTEVADVYADTPLAYSDKEYFEKHAANLKEEIEALLLKYSEKLKAQGLKCDISFCSGNPFVEIVKRARERLYDLIVLGSHGRSGLEYVFMGSVSEQVVRNAPCPVLTVKKRGFKFKPLWQL